KDTLLRYPYTSPLEIILGSILISAYLFIITTTISFLYCKDIIYSICEMLHPPHILEYGHLDSSLFSLTSTKDMTLPSEYFFVFLTILISTISPGKVPGTKMTLLSTLHIPLKS